ncbi:MFS transporter [Nocardia cyriacigeorgica]|uniref:MFS transporter n=1 Tax=Nocardia cyriacigeorgica TaxID=135487 RepID=UPI002458899D|nr:MFS transporter [Nocardia cyriacigeorgica]
MSVATFMLMLDITVVNVALPAIQVDMTATFGEMQWVIDAYALGLAAFLLTSGSLGDRLGRRRMFAIGLVLFTVASAACGLAGDPLLLNIARGAQGVGGAMLYAIGPALIAADFQGKERGAAFGIFGATTGVAVAAGPLLGGLLTELDWRWVFYVNVPIGIVALIVLFTRVPESVGRRSHPIDYAGLGFFSVALITLVFGIIRAPIVGWASAQTLILLAVSVALMAGFVIVELRTRYPMLDLGLLRNRTFDALSVATFAINFAVLPAILFGVLWMQGVLGHSAVETGIRFLPLTAMLFVAAVAGGVLSARLPMNVLIGTALLLAGVGFLLMLRIEPGDSWTAALIPFLVTGLGMGLFNPPRANAAVALVPAEDSGMGSGANETFQQVGAALGIAALGAVAHASIDTSLTDELGLTGEQAEAASDAVAAGAVQEFVSTVPPEQAAHAGEVATAAFVDAFHDVVSIGGVICLVGGLAALLLIRRSDFVLDPAAPDLEAHAEQNAPDPVRT